MPEPKKTPEPDEPQEVKVVNPEPIPVKIQVTTNQPAHTEIDTGNTAAKVAEAVALFTAADKLALEKVKSDKEIALEKIKADERREKREFNKVLILAIPTIIGALAAGYAAIAIRDTHGLVNSRMTELAEEIRKTSRAEGVIEGKAKGKDASE